MTRNNNTRHPLLHEQFGNTLIDPRSPLECVCGVGVWVVVVVVCVMCVLCVSVCGLRHSRVGFRGLCLPCGLCCPSSRLCRLVAVALCLCVLCVMRFLVHTPEWNNKIGLVAYFVGLCAIGIHVLLSQLKFLDVFEDKLPRKHLLEDIFIDQERRRPTTLRYRHRLDHKPCRLENGRRQFHDSSDTFSEIKVPGSGRSMVARVKLKEIDERAPPGVASVALFDTTREKTHHVQTQQGSTD